MRARRENQRSLRRRVLRAFSVGLRAALLIFATAATLTVLTFDSPWVRSLVVRKVDAVLRETFAGTVVIDKVEHIGFTGVGGARFHVDDAEGARVLVVEGASARISLLSLVQSALFGKGELSIDVDEVRLAYADANLDPDPSGHLRLARAFEPRSSEPHASSSRGTVIRLRRVSAGHIWLHGEPRGAPLVDADIDHLDASAEIGPGRTRVDLLNLEVTARGMPSDANVRLRAHLEAGERVAEIDAEARVILGNGMMDVQAHVTSADDLVARIELAARDVDARALSRGAPPTSLGAGATVEVTSRAHGDVTGSYAVDVMPGSVDGVAAPRAHFEGEIHASTSRDGEPPSTSVSGRGRIEEPGVPTTLDVRFRQEGGSSTLGFEVDSSIPRFERTRLGSAWGGSASVRARGSVALGNSTGLDAKLDMDANRVRQGSHRLQSGWLRAHVRGDVTNPVVDAILQANGLRIQDLDFASAVVTLHGRSHDPEVTLSALPNRGPAVEARARVSFGEGITTLRDARLTLSRDDVRAVIEAELVRFARGEARARGIRMEGLGDPVRAEVRASPGALVLRASTNEIDLDRLSRLLDQPDIHQGHLGFDLDVTLGRAGAYGHARLDLQQATIGRVKDGSAHLDAQLDGRALTATAHARLGRIARLDLSPCYIELDGAGSFDGMPWRKARGRVALDAELDVGHLRAILPRGSLPFDEMQGILEIKGEVARNGSELPELRLAASTEGLLLSGRGARERVDGMRIIDSPSWRLEGVDVQLETHVEKTTGATALKARLFDRKGTLASVEAASPWLPYGHWLRARTISAETLRDVSVRGSLIIPSRELKELPTILDTDQIAGTVGGSVEIEGKVLDPAVHVDIRAQGMTSKATRIAGPFDTSIAGAYDHGTTAIDIGVQSARGEVLSGSFRATGKLTELFAYQDANRTWNASARLRLVDFPLETARLLGDFPVKGLATGEVMVDGLHENARAAGKVTVRNVELGRVEFPRGDVRLDFDGARVRGGMRLEQADGFVDARGEIGAHWGREMVPRRAGDEPAFATLKAAGFEAAALLPFVPDLLSELDGRVDADAHIELDAGGGTPRMAGTVALRGAKVQMTRVGEPLHDVNAKVVLSPDGVVRLQEATARVSTGRVTASGTAQLQGFQLRSAEGTIRIPKREAIPVDIDGEDIGEVEGEIKLKAEASQDQRSMAVDIDVPRLHVALPPSSTQKVQQLGEAKDVRIGYFRRARQFVLLPKDAEDLDAKKKRPASGAPARTRNVAIHLRDVEIKRGTTLRAELDGDPSVRIAEQARMSGQVRLKRGTLEVQGKRFEIEKGTVTFVGEDASNPQVVVTAGWTAPDGTRVYADFVGPLKTGKVTLRSEPSRPQNEILALIMFGTADGSSSTPYATPQPDGASRAGAFAGSLATEGLSRGLDDLTGLEISTKIDASNAANPRPEIEVQIARDISLQISYLIGMPPPGVNPDKSMFTVDWRFRRRWSFEASFGDQGSSIMNLIWQYRY
jgi:translocation and assembly module TamB